VPFEVPDFRPPVEEEKEPLPPPQAHEPPPAPEPLPPPPPPEPAYPPQGFYPEQPTEAPPVEKKKGFPWIILILVLLALLLGGGAYYYFKVYNKEIPPVADETPKTPEKAPEGLPGTPAKPLTASERGQRLLDQGASPEELQAVIPEREGNEDDAAVAVLFAIVREVAKYDPEYRVRLGAFYDPLDDRPSYVSKNAMTAFEEYTSAEESGATSSKARLDALRAWALSEQSEGSPGVEALRQTLK
jgi:hypothetical protein